MPNNTGDHSTFFRVRWIDRGDEEHFTGPYAQLGWARRSANELTEPTYYLARPKDVTIQKLTGVWENMED